MSLNSIELSTNSAVFAMQRNCYRIWLFAISKQPRVPTVCRCEQQGHSQAFLTCGRCEKFSVL